MTIGERVKQRRKELGLSQEELAIRMGNRSRASVCAIEKDRDDLTTTRIRKLAKALETTPEYLMGWDEVTQMVSAFSQFARDTDEALSVQRDIDEALSVVRNVEKMKPVEVYPPEAHRTKDKYEFALLQMYRELNEEGQEKLLNYADDLLSSNKYIKNSESEGMEESS